MIALKILALCILIRKSFTQDFPASFKFGAATSAYQIEGGAFADDKGESIWDRYVRTLGTADNMTGDIAGDSYHLWREDIKLIKKLGLQYYRFSISWPRILPSGFSNKISSAGAQYYNDLIDELLRQGIEPVVTMYHFDLPSKLQDLGGWTNPLIADWFEDYARVLFSLYADRVKIWLTINEPIVVCDLAYNTAWWAPGIIEMEMAPYICNKNTMVAHAKAYRLYERRYKNKYNGRISIPNNVLWIDPVDSSAKALELAELGLEHMVGRYSHPIFSKEGGWPKAIQKHMLHYSLKAGYRTSKLPDFTQEEIELIRGTADFYALNYYTGRVIRPRKGNEKPGPWFIDGSVELDVIMEQPPNTKQSSTPLIPVYPKGLRHLLSYMKREYGDIEFLITENGYPSGKGFNDYDRVEFIRDHLKEVLLSINEDKVNVTGYIYWSLFDAFEWASGYTQLFGLYDLDYTDPSLPRTARLSARYYGCVVKHKSLNVSEKCTHSSVISKLAHNDSDWARSSIIVILLICFLHIFHVN